MTYLELWKLLAWAQNDNINEIKFDIQLVVTLIFFFEYFIAIFSGIFIAIKYSKILFN